MLELTKTQTIQAITIYAFLLVIFAVMIRYLIFSKDIENKGVAKIIGGLSVFIVALISQNPAVIGISLFIGGLIIASEEFMQKLAIILRSESKDIGENLKPVSATPQEVKQKQKQEIQETIELLEESQKSVKQLAIKPQELRNYKIEVQNFWKNVFGEKFEENVKIVDPNTKEEIIIDGWLKYDINDNFAEEIFEIRIATSIQDIYSVVEQIQKTYSNADIILHITVISLIPISKNEIEKIKSLETDKLRISLFEANNNQLILKV